MAKAVRFLGYVALAPAAAFIVLGYIGVVRTEGILALRDLLSPFNVWNWALTLLVLSPGIGLIVLADKLDQA